MADMPSTRVEHDGDVAVVTLAHPPANAMDAASLNELAGVFDRLADDVGVTAIVLTGEGRSFSAGLDLKADPTQRARSTGGADRGVEPCLSGRVLVPATRGRAVNGHAIAGGLVLALCCDIRLVADVDVKFGLAEVRVGVPYPVGAIEVVRHELSPPVARRLVLGGDVIGAHAAVELGVFDRVVPAADLLATARSAALDHKPPGRLRTYQGAAAQAGDRGHTSRARRTGSPRPDHG